IGDSIGSSKEPKKRKHNKENETPTKRKSLTSAQKAEICHLKQKGVSQVKLAEQFTVAKATISNIIREKDRWLLLDPGSNNVTLKRQRIAKFPILEEALALWVSKVTSVIIQRKAVQLAKGLDVVGFNASEGWLSNFKKYCHIREYKHQGEATSAPLEDLSRFCNKHEIIKEYKPEDVYNADETALYWHIKPDKTLATKDQVTIMLIFNATGEHTLPLLFIHKYQNSRALRNVDKSILPVYFYWNSCAWMQTFIFNRYIKHFDNQMRLASHSILLFLDSASTHGLEEGYTPTNIKLHIFLQIQQCIFNCIMQELFGVSNEPPELLNIRDAIDFTTAAWKKVTPRTIHNSNNPDLTDMIQSLIGQLPLNQPMDVHKYITANNNLITTEIPTNEEIIEAIRNKNCIEPEDESSKKLISFVQALEFINGILFFLE
ncbi:2316_t:CDS:2, partial [Gigaspora margarita]